MGTAASTTRKICLDNLDLFDFVTLVLKPISKKVLEQLDGDVQVFHLTDFESSDIVQEKKVRRDGGEYTLIKCYGQCNLATTFRIDSDGSVIWLHNPTPRKVMIMGTSSVTDGLFVSLDDLMAAKKPAPVVVGLSGDDDGNDE